MQQRYIALSVAAVGAVGGLLMGQHLAQSLDVRTYTAAGQFLSASPLPFGARLLVAGLITMLGMSLGVLPLLLRHEKGSE
jgi:Cu/Ag efflux pump CusA